MPCGSPLSKAEGRARWAPTPMPTCGARSACAMPAIALACLTRLAATARLALLAPASSIREVKAGSLKASHHWPRGCCSAGWASLQRAPSMPSTSAGSCDSRKAVGVSTAG
ncbi:hypothetical protein [Massilia varians]|uniref:hypothetical protein n=1 Tax=Massilia varians TaxID=457921 RepID=UPI00351D79BA